MAYGIDICAHREALKNNLPTIGVLAHGLHTLYPSVHRVTAREAEQNGGLLTEYTTQQPILKINFVARNRIVAGMTEATLVIESPEKGGALITAHLARDYNREVFALPGNINQECSIGCNRLIRDNVAALVTSAKDIIETMGWETATRSDVKQQPSLFPEISEKSLSCFKYCMSGEKCKSINSLSPPTSPPGKYSPHYWKWNSRVLCVHSREVCSAPPNRNHLKLFNHLMHPEPLCGQRIEIMGLMGNQ